MKYAIVEIHQGQHFLEKKKEFLLSTIISSVGEYNLINKLLILRFLTTIYVGTPYIYNEPIRLIFYNIKNIYVRKLIIFKLKSKKKYRRKLGYKDFIAKYIPLFKQF